VTGIMRMPGFPGSRVRGDQEGPRVFCVDLCAWTEARLASSEHLPAEWEGEEIRGRGHPSWAEEW
jgi:hypothetical protein